MLGVFREENGQCGWCRKNENRSRRQYLVIKSGPDAKGPCKAS